MTRYWQVFFDLHSGLPREGPGCRESTLKALKTTVLDVAPRILDIGCGPGMQTLHLAAEMPDAMITAVDFHQPFLDELKKRAERAGLGDRIYPVKANMQELSFDSMFFDVLWCEGAAYIWGIENALSGWRPLLKESGYIALTEATWLKPNPPEQARLCWKEYPGMGDISNTLDLFKRCGYETLDYFVLPENAWWDDYYTPLERKLPEFKKKYTGDEIGQQVLRECEQEIDCYRKYSDYYGYTFFIGKLPSVHDLTR